MINGHGAAKRMIWSMRPLQHFACYLVLPWLVGCGTSFHYTEHNLFVVDQDTEAPIPSATVRVTYAPVTCGTPFAFLGAPDMPNSPVGVTDENGLATIPLELEWPWGLTLQVSALGYAPGEFSRGYRETPEILVPNSLTLKRDTAR